MNYLAHIYLAEVAGSSLAGNVLGDSVRGQLTGRYPSAIEQGIRLHRAIDSYTDSHPLVTAALRRFQPPLRRYAGICTDIYFDYLLASDWPRWHAHSLQRFAQDSTQTMYREWPHAPFSRQRLAGLADILANTRTINNVRAALDRVDARARRPTPLPEAVPVLQRQHAALQRSFRDFFPDVVAFTRRQAVLISRATQGTDTLPRNAPF